ncbi:MAG: hypothetical protein LBK01_07060 [Burkholderiaceae bacterium]|nr:hypothetical protein [Burkholderiaceae bacterium]
MAVSASSGQTPPGWRIRYGHGNAVVDIQTCRQIDLYLTHLPADDGKRHALYQVFCEQSAVDVLLLRAPAGELRIPEPRPAVFVCLRMFQFGV